MTQDNIKIQLRGNCQCCGRDQAIVGTTMSKHGYTVQDGWFSGVCSGESYKPLQEERTQTDNIIAQVKTDVEALEEQVRKLEAGELFPKEAKSGPYYQAPMIPFKEADEYFQKQAVSIAIMQVKSRIRQGQAFIDYMSKLADDIFKTDLREVVIDTKGPEPIVPGEKRVTEKGTVLECLYTQKGRVYWKTETGRKSWTGTAAWRRMEKV